MSVTIEIPEAFQGLLNPHRYKVFYGGRGGAKSHNMARALLVQGIENPLRILCARELQTSINDSVHKLLADIIAQYGLTPFYEVQNATIKGKNGTQFLFKGLKHNATEIKSTEGIDRVWVEEAEKVSDNSWEVLIPTVRKDNSEIWISFNPKHPTDPTYERFVADATERMLVKKVSYKDNPFFPQVLEDERVALKASDPEAYKHVWEGEFDTRHNGAIFATFIDKARDEGRISVAPYKAGVPVITAWDLGKRNATAIVFAQVVGLQTRIIDYHEATGEQADLALLAQHLRSKPYEYGNHFLPHDAAHERLGMSGSISAQLREYGIDNEVLKIGSKESQRSAARALLQECWVDEANCKDLIHALMSYRFEWDENRQCFKDHPIKDWTTDAADAFQYLAVALETMTIETSIPDALPPINNIGGDYAGFG